MRQKFGILIVTTMLAAWFSPPGAASGADALVLFNAQNPSLEGWKDAWDDGRRSGARIERVQNHAEIIGTETERNYGVVYQYLDWDLDQYPYLEINVVSSNTEWFLIIENPELASGYLKFQKDTHAAGTFSYNLREATGLKGKRRIRLEMGIATKERPGNINLKMRFASLRLVDSPTGTVVKIAGQDAPAEELALQTSLLGWSSSWKSGEPSGAYLSKLAGNKLRLTGSYRHQEYGCVYRNLTVDFNEFPQLEVNVSKVNGHLYLIFEGAQFRGGYYRLKPDISKPGNYIFNLQKDLKYLEGPQNFNFNLGVTTGTASIPVDGHAVEFATVKFVGADKINVVAGSIPSQLIQPPPPLARARKYREQPLSRDYRPTRESLDRGGVLKLFGQQYRLEKPSQTLHPAVFGEQGDQLVVSNAYYQVTLNRKSGNLLAIEDKRNNATVSWGSEQPYLWRILKKDGDFINAAGFLNGAGTGMTYQWLPDTQTLKLQYRRPRMEVVCSFQFSQENYFDLTAAIDNQDDQPLLAFDVPRLAFDYQQIDRFYLPYGMGVAFNQKFFAGKRQWKTTYPTLFADFVHWSFKNGGQFTAFLNWAEKPVRPTRLHVGYSPARGGCGVFEHGWTIYLRPGESWAGQPLRMVVGESIETAIQRYRQDNQLTRAPKLAEKLGRELFDKLRKGVLLKVSLDMNRDFSYVKSFLPELPYGTIVHYVTWWLEGFDRHMPDFWPVNPIFGSNEDFKRNVEQAKALDLTVMPYTNNTFWNLSPTLTRVGGPEAVACRDLNNQPIFEVYPSGGKGWAVSPRHPAVQATGRYIADRFFNEYKMDMLFLDQIGARFIDYDFHPTLKDPTAYAHYWYEHCLELVKKGPLYTEQGYDRLIPLMSGFCGLASFTFPESMDYNIWWGEGAWEYFPIAQYLSHENVLFYHHNLAHEVFCDSHRKIAFYLAHGYNMYNGRWVSEWRNQERWFLLADQLQKHVVSLYAGQPLMNYAQIEPHRVIWSAYPDLGILANLSDNRDYPVLNHAVAPNGFIATDRQGAFLAGRFTRLYGYDLSEPQYLVIQRLPNKMIVNQLENTNSLISLPRPTKWKISEAITVRVEERELPFVAITPDTITFHTDSDLPTTGAVRYLVEYAPDQQPRFSLEMLSPDAQGTPNTPLRIGMQAQNKSGQAFADVQLVLSAWLVKRNTPVIQPQAGFATLTPEQYLKTDLLDQWQPDKTLSAEFELQVPSTAQAGDIIWLKGEIISREKQQFQMQSVVPVSAAFEVGMEVEQEQLISDQWAPVNVKVKNNFNKKVRGALKLQLPRGWKGKIRQHLSLKPGQTKEIQIKVKPPSRESRETAEVKAAFQVKRNVTETAPLKLAVTPLWRVNSCEGIRVLAKGQQVSGMVRLITHPGKRAAGRLTLKPSGGLAVEPRDIPFDISEGGEQLLRFKLTAKQARDQQLTFQIDTEYGRQSWGAVYPVVPEGKAVALTGNLLNRGDEDYILANAEVEVQAVRDMGGRILAFYHRASGANGLYQNYPNVVKQPQSKDWVEYGGINDWFPSGWPGFVWNNQWEASVVSAQGKEAVVVMSTETENNLRLERRMTLPAQGRQLRLDYTVTNLSQSSRRYQWFNHPDLAPGLFNYASDSHRIIVPIADPADPDKTLILKGKFNAKIGKDTYVPREGWVVAEDSSTGFFFMQKFDVKQIGQIGVWQDAIFYTMELLGNPEELKAGESKQFTVFYQVGEKNWEAEL